MPKIKLTPPSGFRTSNDLYYIMDMSDKSNRVDFYTPEAVTEKPSQAQYSTSDAIGRGGSYMTYTNSDNRQLDLDLTFMDDYTQEPLIKIKNRLSAMQTPTYSSGQVRTNTVQLRLGGLVVRGVLQNLSFNWDGPIRNGTHIRLVVTLSVTETRTVPLGKSEVLSGTTEKEW